MLIPSELVEEIIKYADDLVVITPLIDEEDQEEDQEEDTEENEEEGTDEDEENEEEPKPLLFNLEFNFRPTKISICCETWKNTTDGKTSIYFGMKEKVLDGEEMPISYLDDILEAYQQKKQFRLRFPFKKYNSFGSSTVSIDTFSGKTYIEYIYDPYDSVFGFSVTVDVPDTERLISSFKHQLLQLWSKMEKST